jgi:hypothetical protein
MRLKIKDVSFTNDCDWLFKLSDGFNEYYVLTNHFYEKMGLKTPISKNELDYLDVGHSILCEVKDFDGKKVVTKII